MQSKSKKLLSKLLVFVMVFSMFAAMPFTAGAADKVKNNLGTTDELKDITGVKDKWSDVKRTTVKWNDITGVKDKWKDRTVL